MCSVHGHVIERIFTRSQAVQARLVEENETLSVERSQLSDLITNVQRMHHDMEQSGENDRRRLESQISMLENQT